ncbi:hypothetical protein [Nocardiopsis flavescens]
MPDAPAGISVPTRPYQGFPGGDGPPGKVPAEGSRRAVAAREASGHWLKPRPKPVRGAAAGVRGAQAWTVRAAGR